MKEKDILGLGEPGQMWDVCDEIVRAMKGIGINYSVPKGNRPAQYDTAVKYAMGKRKIPWDIGTTILRGIAEKPDETVDAIRRIAGSERDLVEAWLL